MAVAQFSSRILLALLWLVVSAQGHSRSIEKRSDDSDPLTSVVEQLTSRVTQLEAQVQANKNNLDDVQRTVGFSVRTVNDDITGLSVSQTIKFDNVVLNAGNGYSPLTGAFTAPFSGTYVFYLQMLSYGSAPRIVLGIMKNGHVLTLAHAGFSSDENGSTLIVTQLNQGDLVHVQVVEGSSFWGGPWGIFAGFRISTQ